MALSKQDRHTLATAAKGKEWHVLPEEPGFQPKGIGARLCRRMPKPYGWVHLMFGHPDVLAKIAENQNQVAQLCEERDKLISKAKRDLAALPSPVLRLASNIRAGRRDGGNNA